MFKFSSFLVSISVNNVYKLLEILGDFIPRPYQGFASGQHWGISVPQTAWAIAPQIKIPGAPLITVWYFSDEKWRYGLEVDKEVPVWGECVRNLV